MTKPILIKKLGIERQVIELKANGLGAKAIANALKEKGYTLSYKAVENFLKVDVGIKKEVIAVSKDLQQKVVVQELDTISQINRLNVEMWNTLEQLKMNEDYKSIPAVANSLTKLLELQSRLLGQLHPESDITVILAGLNKK